MNIEKNECEFLRDLLVEAVEELAIYDNARFDFVSKYKLLRKVKKALGDRFPKGIYVGEDKDFE